MERVRAIGSLGVIDRHLWTQLGEAGIFSLRQADGNGGAGLGVTHAVLVFEELGKFLVPGPLIASHLAAGIVEGAATGETVVGLVESLPVGSNKPLLVEHFESLDALVVLADDGLFQVDPASVEARPISNGLDPLTPLHK